MSGVVAEKWRSLFIVDLGGNFCRDKRRTVLQTRFFGDTWGLRTRSDGTVADDSSMIAPFDANLSGGTYDRQDGCHRPEQ
jgi:hypothetical protein